MQPKPHGTKQQNFKAYHGASIMQFGKETKSEQAVAQRSRQRPLVNPRPQREEPF